MDGSGLTVRVRFGGFLLEYSRGLHGCLLHGFGAALQLLGVRRSARMFLLLLLFRDYKVYIALLLAFLVVLARANLSTFLGSTVIVLFLITRLLVHCVFK